MVRDGASSICASLIWSTPMGTSTVAEAVLSLPTDSKPDAVAQPQAACEAAPRRCPLRFGANPARRAAGARPHMPPTAPPSAMLPGRLSAPVRALTSAGCASPTLRTGVPVGIRGTSSTCVCLLWSAPSGTTTASEATNGKPHAVASPPRLGPSRPRAVDGEAVGAAVVAAVGKRSTGGGCSPASVDVRVPPLPDPLERKSTSGAPRLRPPAKRPRVGRSTGPAPSGCVDTGRVREGRPAVALGVAGPAISKTPRGSPSPGGLGRASVAAHAWASATRPTPSTARASMPAHPPAVAPP